MEKELKSNNKVMFLILCITLILTIVGVLVTTYAFFNYTRTGEANKINTGNIKLTLNDTDNNINLTNQFPIADNEAYNTTSNGMEVVITEFIITGFNTSKTNTLQYVVKAIKGEVDDSKSRFKDSEVKLYLDVNNNGKGTINVLNGYNTKDTANGIYGALASEGNDGIDTSNDGEITLAQGQVAKEETTHKYTLRLWISDKVNISDTESSYTYCATESECLDDRDVYSNLYYSLKIKVENL